MNQLNLIFGPSLPASIEALGLSFVAAPVLQPDTSIASLSAERYVAHNYAHRQKLTILESSKAGQGLTVSAAYGGTDAQGLFGNVAGAFSLPATRIQLKEDAWGLEVLHSPLVVEALEITRAGSWAPRVRAGVTYRRHVVSEQEPADSWLRRSWTALGSGLVKDGDEIVLIYTLPEARYGTQTTLGGGAWPAGSQLRARKEVARVASPNSIAVERRVQHLTKVTVNGAVRFNGAFENSDSDPFVQRIDNDLRLVHLWESLVPRDLVEVEYTEYVGDAVYTGYRDYQDVWFAFDANPEYGHWIADPRVGTLRPSADCLLEQVTLYLVPTAYVVVKRTDGDPDDPLDAGRVDLTFVSAYEYGETHFLRHRIGDVGDEGIVERMADGSVNTWGHAVLGVHHYDEGRNFQGDVFDRSRPSSMPLGRIVLAAPAAVDSVAVADIRKRGGGIPEEFPMSAVTTQEDGLDRLRSFWDMGIWDGKVVKEGGVAQIELDRSVLDEFSSTEVEEFVRSMILPGIAYEINYVDF